MREIRKMRAVSTAYPVRKEVIIKKQTGERYEQHTKCK